MRQASPRRGRQEAAARRRPGWPRRGPWARMPRWRWCSERLRAEGTASGAPEARSDSPRGAAAAPEARAARTGLLPGASARRPASARDRGRREHRRRPPRSRRRPPAAPRARRRGASAGAASAAAPTAGPRRRGWLRRTTPRQTQTEGLHSRWGPREHVRRSLQRAPLLRSEWQSYPRLTSRQTHRLHSAQLPTAQPYALVPSPRRQSYPSRRSPELPTLLPPPSCPSFL
mmetsp:Transcript_98990/g.268859  ORF Transcript_98990/g.268859 Transcript_98990/m.268859 type:complete len:230 (+) Transcript_98990:996-1685(+)